MLIEHVDYVSFTKLVNAELKKGGQIKRLSQTTRLIPWMFGIKRLRIFYAAEVENQNQIKLVSHFGPVREQS